MACESQSPAFSYEALPDSRGFIRLLELQSFDEAASHGYKCQCRLTIWSLAGTPRFHAISYAWGDATQTESILINEKPHRVRSTCLYVLKQASWHGGSRYYWVDAICINQIDDEEKSYQVQMMGQIFNRADGVLACVGPPADDSDYLWHMLWKHQGNPSGSVQYKTHMPSGKSALALLKWRASISYPDARRLLSSYSAFIERPYFSRVWVAQELLLAQSVTLCCGNKFQPFQNLTTMAILLHNIWTYFCSFRGKRLIKWLSLTPTLNARLLGVLNTCPAAAISSVHEHTIKCLGRLPFLRRFPVRNFPMRLTSVLLQGDRSAYSQLYTAIMKMQLLNCYDPRDRVYGILALIDWNELGPIIPNYTISLFQLTTQVLEKLAELQDIKLRHHRVNQRSSTSILPTISGISSTLGLTSASQEFKGAMRLRKERELLPWPQYLFCPDLKRYRDRYWFGWRIPSSECWERIDKSMDQEALSHGSSGLSTFNTDAPLHQLHTPTDEIGISEAILIAGSARPNDWVAVPGSRPGHPDGNACLVLQQQGDEFAIVGRALRRPFRISQRASRDKYALLRPMEHFELRFDAEDILVLVIQAELDSTHEGILKPSSIDSLQLSLASKVCRTEWSSYAVRLTT